jgi:hypothetical protein
VRTSSAARGRRRAGGRAPPRRATAGRRALPCGEPVRGVTLRSPCTTGNGHEMRFPLCRLSLSFCISLAWLTPYAAYQSPASCTTQARTGLIQAAKHPLSSELHSPQFTKINFLLKSEFLMSFKNFRSPASLLKCIMLLFTSTLFLNIMSLFSNFNS